MQNIDFIGMGGTAAGIFIAYEIVKMLVAKIPTPGKLSNPNNSAHAARCPESMQQQVQEIRDTMLVAKPEKQKDLIYDVLEIQKNTAENVNNLTKMESKTLDKIDNLIDSVDDLTKTIRKSNGG